MQGLIGKKVGMTTVFDENGKSLPCTVLEVGPCVVSQVKTKETDGYSALQLSFDDKKEKASNKAEIGHYKQAGTAPKRKAAEFSGFEEGKYKRGDVITWISSMMILTLMSEDGPRARVSRVLSNVMASAVWAEQPTASMTGSGLPVQWVPHHGLQGLCLECVWQAVREENNRKRN